MENYLFPQKCITGGWPSSSHTSWAINIILALLCGLGLFFLLLSYFQPDASLPPRTKHRNSRKPQVEPRRRRSSSKKKNQTLKAFRDCLQELEEVQDLFSLLQSHLGRLADQGGFHQLLRQAAPGHLRKAAPAGARQPCREPVEDATPTVAASPFPAPPTGGPPPLASTVSPEPMTSSISVHSHYSQSTSWPSEPSLPPFGLSHQPLALLPSPPCLSPSEAGRPPLTASSAPAGPDSLQTLPQCNSMAASLRSIPQSSSPHTLWLASPVPAISGLGRSSCPIPALSWWQATAKAWGLSTSTRLESHQEPLSHSPPRALFWGDPTHRQGEMRIPPFINPDVQKLLEILIAKRTELKIWKEKEKKERSDGHLNSFGRIFKSPGDKQDTMGCQSFWSMSGKPNQLLGPEKPPHSKISADNLQQKCSQLFWGLPFLHSESLVATVRVTDSSLEFPSVIFNELSHALPLQIQTNVAPHLSLTQSLPDTLVQPQPLTLSLSQSQPLPLDQPQPLPLDQPQPLPLDQPQPLPLPLDKPQPLPLTQPQPLPLAQPQPLPLPLDQPQPLPLPLNQPQPLPLDQPQPQPLSLPLDQPQPLPLDQPQPLPLDQLQPQPLAQPQPQPQPLPLPLDQPQPLPLDQLQPLPLAQPQPLPLPLDQLQPLPLPLDQLQPLPLPLDQLQPLPLPLAQPQPPPLDQPQPQAHLAPSVPIGPPCLPPKMGTCEVSCPASQKTPSFISNAIQNLECHFLKKQQDGDWTLPAVVKRSQEVFSQGPPDLPQDAQAPQGHGAVSVLPGDLINSELREQLEWHLWKRLMKHQSGLPRRIQLSVKLVQPHGEFQKVPEAHSRHRPAWSSESTDGSCQAAQKPGSRYSARTVPGKSLGKDSRSSAGRIQKDLHRASASSPGKAPGINSEESDTDLRPLTSSADEEPPEKVLRAHLGRKLGQIREGQIPADVHHSRFAANHASDLPGTPSTHRKTGKPAFSKGWEPYRTTTHDFSILSPYTQRMLEAHIIRFRVKHRWSLPLKVLKPINLFKLKKSFLFPRSSTPRLGTCASKTRSKTKFLGKPPQPHQGEVMGESIPTSGVPLPAPQPSCEEIQPGLEGTSSGDGHGPWEAPLAGQEARPPSQTLTYSFVGRIWHSETAQGTLTNSSLESSPSPAMATNEPRKESGSRASRDSCCSVTVLELDLESQYLSARKEAREVKEVEEAPAWGVTSEPCVLANNQTINADLRRSRSSGKSDNPLPPTKLVAQDPEERCLDAQLREFELRKLVQSESQPQDEAANVLLQDCETGVLLQDCATDSLLQDCQSDVFLAADILASQGSLSGFQSGSSEDTSTSQMLYDRKSSRQNSQRQPEPPGLQDPCKRPRKSSVSTDDRGCYRRPRPGEPEKELSELKIFQISEMRHPVQEKESAQSSGSKVCQLLLKKEEAPPESYFRRRMRNFLQWFFPNKGKGLESSLQKGKSSSSQSRAKVRGRSAVDSAPAEAQVVLTAVGQILEEKMVPHHGVRAPDYSWCKRDRQASAGPNVCYHRVLSYQEQRRVMRETASYQQATPKSHSCANKTEWIRGRDNRWAFPARMPGCPGRPCQYASTVPGPSGHPAHPHCPRHCLLQRYVSSGQSVCAAHAFPSRAAFLQEKMQTVQRKTFFSHVSTSSMG